VSVAGIATRVAAIDSRIQQLRGTPDAAATTTSFASALQTAQAAAPANASAYDDQIATAAARYGIDPALLKGLIRQESNFDPTATSSAGARGLTQLMPSTAAALGVDPSDPAQAIDGGARYLKEQLDRFGGDPAKALAAYNAGPGAVTAAGGVPPYAETQAYVQRVLAYAQQYGMAAPAATTTALPAATTPVLAQVAGGLDYSTI